MCLNYKIVSFDGVNSLQTLRLRSTLKPLVVFVYIGGRREGVDVMTTSLYKSITLFGNLKGLIK